MKKIFAPLCLLVTLCFACNREPEITTLSYHSENCAQCPAIAINIPNFASASRSSRMINNKLREIVINLIDQEGEAGSVQEAMKRLSESFYELQLRYPDITPNWEVKIDSKITYKDDNVISIQIDSYSYTGGAHGYGKTSFLNFNAKTGKWLQTKDLFKNEKAFERLAEGKFRQLNDLGPEANINSNGYMFENDRFHLPNNIGITPNGLLLIYNPYEIAAYTDGSQSVNIPFSEIDSIMNRTFPSF